MNTVLNRRQATTSVLAALAIGIGADAASAADPPAAVPLERAMGGGTAAPSVALIVTQLAATLDREDDGWRTALHQAAALSDQYTRDELMDTFDEVTDRPNPLRDTPVVHP